MPDDEWVLDKAQSTKRESARVDFKQSFDVGNKGAWCEIIKDIVAMWNTKGGVTLIGLDNGGNPSGIQPPGERGFDSADIINKIEKYTGLSLDYASVCRFKRGSQQVAAIVVEAGDILIAFDKDGQYAEDSGKPKCAFSRGIVYFRRGSKSEPGGTEEIRAWFERQMEAEHKRGSEGMRKVFTAPPAPGSRPFLQML